MQKPLSGSLEPLSDTPKKADEPNARLVEVFSSIQGEGVFVGHRQLFVRTYGCNIRCTYCDSPETLKESPSPPFCRVEWASGKGEFSAVPNPLSPTQLTDIVKSFRQVPHHSIVLTGGEPLLQVRFWENWLPDVRALGLKTFLETNGLLPHHLQRILPYLDYISMDFKAPTATGLDAETTWETHRKFLEIARKTFVYTKLVVTPRTTDTEVDRVVELLSSVDASIPLILQPVTPFGSEAKSVSPARLLALQARAARRLEEVRVIPQTHKIMQLL